MILVRTPPAISRQEEPADAADRPRNLRVVRDVSHRSGRRRHRLGERRRALHGRPTRRPRVQLRSRGQPGHLHHEGRRHVPAAGDGKSRRRHLSDSEALETR